MSKPAVDDFSRSFYPFLHEDQKQPEELMAQMAFSLLEKARESVEVKTRFFEANKETIIAASLDMAKAFHRGRKLLVCGNGGSATDAQHVAVEFMHPITVGRKALPAICLTNDMAMVTAVANDVGFDDVFSRQIIALGAEGELKPIELFEPQRLVRLNSGFAVFCEEGHIRFAYAWAGFRVADAGIERCDPGRLVAFLEKPEIGGFIANHISHNGS